MNKKSGGVAKSYVDGSFVKSDEVAAEGAKLQPSGVFGGALMLLGDEAVAMAAIHAGISASFAYPGTPATEIQEAIQKYAHGVGEKCPSAALSANSQSSHTHKYAPVAHLRNALHLDIFDQPQHPYCGINSKWSINEKVAMEEAVGVSMMGLRSLVNMKHVGLNVAADPFMNSAVTGARGGLVVAVADDPSMHSSQNEQDSRYYADFAQIPCFEPSNQQEAYDMTRKAFVMSEELGTPIILRLVTRLAHTRASVKFSNPEKRKELSLPEDFKQWTLLPTNARPQYEKLLAKQKEFIKSSNEAQFNKLEIKKGAKLGVVASGLGYNYFMEAVEGNNIECSSLKIGQYPLPVKFIEELAGNVSEILVVEEGYPFIERHLPSVLLKAGKLIQVSGKLNNKLPLSGELNTDIVRKAFGLKVLSTHDVPTDLVKSRPPALCKGCPHCDTFNALNKALAGKEKDRLVFSDIGCYTLGAYPPYEAIHSCLCMGASISMALSASECGLKYPIAIIGDSTFNHSGITPLLEGIKRNAPFTTIILDNSTTAMTGGQDTICGEEALEKLVLGMGIDSAHMRVIEALPKNHDKNVEVIKEEIEYHGASVVIARRACLQARS